MNKLDGLKVGDTVYLLAVGNMHSRCKDKSIEDRIREVEVTKVGRKYITTNNDCQFDKTDDYREKTVYTPDWEIYATKQDIYDKRDSEILSSDISDYFRYGKNNLTLDQLKRIKAIIDEEVE